MSTWTATHAATTAETARITALYREAQTRIITALDRARARGNDTTHLLAAKGEVDAILADLRDVTGQWAQEAYPHMYTVGMDAATTQLARAGVTAAVDFAGIHQQAVAVLAENAYNRLADVTNVVGRQVDDYYRALALENIKGAVLGIDTTRDAQQAIFSAYMQRNDTLGVAGFVDRSGREWSMDVYSEMVARTTLADTMRTGSRLRMAEAGVESFQVIGGPNPCEDCQAAIDGSPYTSDELDALEGDSGHFTGPNCECTIVADTAALDAMGE